MISKGGEVVVAANEKSGLVGAGDASGFAENTHVFFFGVEAAASLESAYFMEEGWIMFEKAFVEGYNV